MLFVLAEWNPHEMVGFAAPNKIQLKKETSRFRVNRASMLKPLSKHGLSLLPPPSAVLNIVLGQNINLARQVRTS